MGVMPVKCGFGKRKKRVADVKLLKRKMVQAIVKKMKAEGKPVDREAINRDVLDAVRRKRQSRKPKHAV